MTEYITTNGVMVARTIGYPPHHFNEHIHIDGRDYELTSVRSEMEAEAELFGTTLLGRINRIWTVTEV